jgi:murein DD-endopeptidase MepM/ murein hydrolase activator NlpD
MEASAAIRRISELLDQGEQETSNTSMRIPVALRDAAALAVRELGIASSATALTTAALRATLEAVVMQSVLDDHYAHYQEARPELGELALAAAEIDGHPLAAEPERLRLAAAEIAARHPAATPDDVLLWAEARAFAAA